MCDYTFYVLVMVMYKHIHTLILFLLIRIRNKISTKLLCHVPSTHSHDRDTIYLGREGDNNASLSIRVQSIIIFPYLITMLALIDRYFNIINMSSEPALLDKLYKIMIVI